MDKKNKIILVVLIILTLCVVGICVYSVISDKQQNTDAIKFLEEYTELNDKVNEYNGKNYINVTIDEKNTIKYVNEEEAVKLLENGTGVMYFGFSTCPWCRSLVSTLTSVAKDKNETIYYLDILDLRSSFEVVEGKLNKKKDGTVGYYKLLNLLDKELEEFTLTDSEGKVYKTDEKRLYAPTLVAFKDGEVTSFHVGTVESQESGFDELTKSQKEELEKIISDLIKSKNENEVCTSDKC